MLDQIKTAAGNETLGIACPGCSFLLCWQIDVWSRTSCWQEAERNGFTGDRFLSPERDNLWLDARAFTPVGTERDYEPIKK